MSRPRPRGFALATFCLALGAGPASALTAPELWDDAKAYTARLGATLSAESRSYEGGTLRLDGVLFEQTVPTEHGPVASVTRMGSMSLVEEGDAVRVVLAPVTDVTSTSTLDGRTTEIAGRLLQEGNDYVVRDVDGLRVHDLEAVSWGIEIDDVTAGAGGAGGAPVPMAVTLRDLAGTYRSGADDTYEQDLSIDRLAVGLDSSGNSGGIVLDYAVDAVEGTLSGTLPPEGADTASTLAMLGEVDMALTNGGTAFTLVGSQPTGDVVVDVESAAGYVDLSITDAALGYGAGSSDLEMAVSSPSLPQPLRMTSVGTRTLVEGPLAQGDGQPFAMELRLDDLVLDDAGWALFDPTGQLPREPASLSLSLSGVADVTADPRAVRDGAEGLPFEPRTLSVDDLALRLAGAALTGGGSVAFADGPDGVPVPDGTLRLALDGGMALLDQLVAIGLLPAGQAMGARAMMGMIARDVGGDRLETTITFGADGSIDANGLRLR